ncbi:MAG TPA: M48 family metallopeptidase [Dissulfurispiraceae bacterium]|nr:M48 family metallopeptidase [Dissulfurispiraceae bacterium]
MLSVNGRGLSRAAALADLEISEPLDGAPRTLRFSDGASCELQDTPALAAHLAASGHAESLVVRTQRRWHLVAAAFAALAIILFAGYRWVLPLAAEKLAFRMPHAVLERISSQAIAGVEGKWIFPSQLPENRQEKLRKHFASLALPPHDGVTTRVEFRSGGMLGPNAFALPDGTIIFFDELVKLAENDDELVAVFAHEAGHAAHRHGLRQIIQQSVVALVLAAYIGDVSTLGGAVSGWLLEAKYSRDFERDADRYAAQALKMNNLSPLLLGEFLMKLEQAHLRQKGGTGGNITNYLSTHPPTEERMKAMQDLATQ